MTEQPTSMLESTCINLFEHSKGTLTWSWDDRFQAVLAQFSINTKDEIIGMLEQHLGTRWDHTNISKSPRPVALLANDLGGIRPGQLLYTTDPNHDTILFCAWWPWGNGQTISIRIAPIGKGISDSQPSLTIEAFKSWFGL